jgi:hypothetical protein
MKPTEFKDLNLDSLFGKVEMELAVKAIINKAIKSGDCIDECPVDIFDFNSDAEKRGFCFLLYYGWMDEDENSFVVNERVMSRLMDRKIMSNNLGKEFEHLSADCAFIKFLRFFQEMDFHPKYYVGKKHKGLVIEVLLNVTVGTGGSSSSSGPPTYFHFYYDGRFDHCDRSRWDYLEID